jgi:hypothetical protein
VGFRSYLRTLTKKWPRSLETVPHSPDLLCEYPKQIGLPDNGAEYEPESKTRVHKLLETLPFFLLLLYALVTLVEGVREPSPTRLSIGVCLGGFTTFLIARVWLGGAPVVER